MRRHASMVYATCLKVTRDPHDAEDATQATFLTLASKSRLNGEIRQPEAWLRKVAHRLSLDLIRSKKRRINRENVRSEMSTEEAPLDSHDHADKGEVKKILNEELAKLPASYRMPLILHYFGGLSRDEMAEQLKLKPSTLGVRLHRAREQLRRRLANRGILLPTVALTALLSEVVRSGVCSHMMSSTARQASAIVLGQTTFHAAAPAMFSPATGFDSVGALLSSLAGGKLKVFLSALAVASMISLTSANVREWIPAAIKAILPSFSAPSIPKIEFTVPVPRLLSDTTPVQRPSEPTPMLAAPVGPMPIVAIGESDVSTRLAAAAPQVMSPSAWPGSTLRPSVSTSAPRRVEFNEPAKLITTPPAVSRVATASVAPANVAAPAARSVGESASASTPATIARASSPNSDPWNGVLSTRGSDAAGPAIPGAALSGTSLSDGEALDAVPASAVSAVSGPVPGVASAGGGGGSASGASVPSKAQITGNVPTSTSGLLASRTTVFAGTSTNYGGYADETWQSDSLTDVSGQLLDETPTTTLDVGPAIPGQTLSINGARVTLHNTTETGDLSVAFVDTSAADVPVLPTGHQFIGVWQLDCHEPFESADLLVRYDDLRAARLGLNEQILKLWVSNGDGWQLLWNDPTFGRDVNQNLLWVTAPGDFKFFAVSAPEPGVMLTLLAASGLALRRRRK